MIQIFYAVIRATLKRRPTLPSDTLQYIEALELVAKKAVLLWAVMRSGNEQAQIKAADALHEALQSRRLYERIRSKHERKKAAILSAVRCKPQS